MMRASFSRNEDEQHAHAARLLVYPQAPKKKVAPAPLATKKVRPTGAGSSSRMAGCSFAADRDAHVCCCWCSLVQAAPKKETNPLFEKRPKNFGEQQPQQQWGGTSFSWARWQPRSLQLPCPTGSRVGFSREL